MNRKSDTPQFFKELSERKPLAIIRKDGRPYFNGAAARFMKLHPDVRFKLGKGITEKCIYLFPIDSGHDTIGIVNYGGYYRINLPEKFRQLGCVKGERYLVTEAIYKEQVIYKINL